MTKCCLPHTVMDALTKIQLRILVKDSLMSGGAKHRSTNLPTGGWPSLHLELQPLYCFQVVVVVVNWPQSQGTFKDAAHASIKLIKSTCAITGCISVYVPSQCFYWAVAWLEHILLHSFLSEGKSFTFFLIFILNLRYLFIFQTCITILILPLLTTILLVE